MSTFTTISNLVDGSTLNIQGTKVNGESYNRTVEFSKADNTREDILVVTEGGNYKSFQVAGIQNISVL